MVRAVVRLMPDAQTPQARSGSLPAETVVNALAAAVFVVDSRLTLRFVNTPAEELFDAGAARLIDTPVTDLLPLDSPLFFLIDRVLAGARSMSQTGILLETPRIGAHLVDAHVTPILNGEPYAAVTLLERSISQKIDNQLSHRSAARSVSAMAAMLAHEVKNPMSGIRGAAQLLEDTVSEQDLGLIRLIFDEADRIISLVNRLEVFSDQIPLQRSRVNIHSVLEHVRKVAQTGFARHVRFVEKYDPSLPAVFGDRDQLVQVFLNLVKNAAEAVPTEGGEIVLATSYQHGVRLAAPNHGSRMHVPLLVEVQDNGGGIPEDLRPHLFDAFVTTKASGNGLGLALVAKIIGDHGGVIEVESVPRRTVFKVSLPMFADADAAV